MIGPCTMALLEREANTAFNLRFAAREFRKSGKDSKAAAALAAEQGSLIIINQTLLNEGLPVNKRVVIGGQHFRVAPLGCPVVHIGAVLPEGEIDDDKLEDYAALMRVGQH